MAYPSFPPFWLHDENPARDECAVLMRWFRPETGIHEPQVSPGREASLGPVIDRRGRHSDAWRGRPQVEHSLAVTPEDQVVIGRSRDSVPSQTVTRSAGDDAYG